MLKFYTWPTPEELAIRRRISVGGAETLLMAIEEMYGQTELGLDCLNFVVDITIHNKLLERFEQYKVMEPPPQSKELVDNEGKRRR